MTEEANEKLSSKVTWPQWIAGIGATLLMAQSGLMGGWSSPYIAQLTSPESSLSITIEEGSWVVSLFNLGRLIGAIGGAICVNYFGSKTTILFTCLPNGLCWLFTIVANRVEWLYSSRLFGGITLGMTYSCFSIYLGEIADANIRGALVALGISGLTIGNFVMSIMGAYLPMDMSGIISLASCFIQAGLFIWLPESPHHLIKKKQYDKAKSSIRFYHRNCDVESEFLILKKFVESLSSHTFLNTLAEFKSVQFRKSLFITLVLFMYSQLCGVNNILFYMETILISAKVTAIKPAIVVIIVMAFGIIGSFLSMFLMDRFGRKILMNASCIGVTVSLCILTLEFQLLSFGFDPSSVEGLTIFSLLVFYLAVFIGVLPVPPAVLSELFPPHLKCFAACIASSMAGIFAFISTATYLPLLNLITEQYVFLFYGLSLLTAVPFTIFWVPETKGMTLQEIQNQLVRKR
ncbi:uncharacterized protein LOC143188992 [Calliopsis andreniformis]|uniref:uncharacterized protein LOC143188992 n=1 Tax=Calliopsis andreniformis TaxID=337506 RepID=UPI003FCCC586